jgi:hypothetical protein
MSRIILKKDWIIPAGTVFENCDGLNVQFASDNFEAIQGTGKDGIISIYIDKETTSDKPEQFEFVDS